MVCKLLWRDLFIGETENKNRFKIEKNQFPKENRKIKKEGMGGGETAFFVSEKIFSEKRYTFGICFS